MDNIVDYCESSPEEPERDREVVSILGYNIGYLCVRKVANMHWLGIEPRSTAWKAAMLTITLPMHLLKVI